MASPPSPSSDRRLTVAGLAARVVALAATALVLIATTAPEQPPQVCLHPAVASTFAVSGSCGPAGDIVVESAADSCAIAVSGAAAVGLPAAGRFVSPPGEHPVTLLATPWTISDLVPADAVVSDGGAGGADAADGGAADGRPADAGTGGDARAPDAAAVAPADAGAARDAASIDTGAPFTPAPDARPSGLVKRSCKVEVMDAGPSPLALRCALSDRPACSGSLTPR
jgi:hypothetical protein